MRYTQLKWRRIMSFLLESQHAFTACPAERKGNMYKKFDRERPGLGMVSANCIRSSSIYNGRLDCCSSCFRANEVTVTVALNERHTDFSPSSRNEVIWKVIISVYSTSRLAFVAADGAHRQTPVEGDRRHANPNLSWDGDNKASKAAV